jgi:hypothetical protein
MALITYWSGQGSLPIDQPLVADTFHGFQHRIAHLISFALVGLLARWAFDGWPRAALLAVFLTSLFGASDEWHQSFTPGRRAAIDDWVLDTAAAALGLYIVDRIRTSRLRPYFTALTPLLVSAAFLVGVGLAARPLLSAQVQGLGVRAAASSAIQVVRETRAATRVLAHQVRVSVSG